MLRGPSGYGLNHWLSVHVLHFAACAESKMS